MFYWEKCSGFQSEVRASVFSSIEDMLDIEFPSMTKRFMLTYLTGQYFEGGNSYIDKYLRATPCYSIDAGDFGPDNFFNWLYSPEEIVFNLQEGRQGRTVFKDKGLLQIGSLHAGMLFVDYKTDRIFSARYAEDLVFDLVAGNIYEFASRFKFQVKDKFSKLKKYGNSKYWADPSVEYSLNNELVSAMASSQEENRISLLEPALTLPLRLDNAASFRILLSSSVVEFLGDTLNEIQTGTDWLRKVEREELIDRLMLERIFNNLLEDPYRYPEIVAGVRSSVEIYSTDMVLYSVSGKNINILGCVKRMDLIRT